MYWYKDGYVYGVSTLYFQFGSVTYFRDDSEAIIYRTGQEDLPPVPDNLAKISIAKGEISPNENLDIFIYEADNIVPLKHGHQVKTKYHNLKKGTIEYLLQDSEISTEKGKTYIVVPKNEKGIVVDVEKIIL